MTTKGYSATTPEPRTDAGVGSPFAGGALYDLTGSFVVPLVAVGCLGLVGAAAYALVVGRVEPLPLPDDVTAVTA